MNNTNVSNQSIVHLSSELSLRGGERQCLLLHAELLKKGYTSYILCHNQSQLALQPVPYISTHMCNGFLDWAGLLSLSKICKNLSASILHCHDSKSFTLGSILKLIDPKLAIMYSRKVLFPIRNTRFNRWKFSRCAHCIAVSHAVAQVCSHIAPKTPVTIIHDAAQTGVTLLSRDEARLQLGLKPNDIGVGSVAFFTQEKNLDLIITCANHFENINPLVKFILIGPIETMLEPILKKKKSIILTKQIHNAVSLYNAFDAYLSTSTSEGLGSALLDAIVRDIPCAALDAGGTRDLFGTFDAPARTADELLKQLSIIFSNYTVAQTKASQLGQWARTVFTSEVFISKHIELYDSISCNYSINNHTTVPL